MLLSKPALAEVPSAFLGQGSYLETNQMALLCIKSIDGVLVFEVWFTIGAVAGDIANITSTKQYVECFDTLLIGGRFSSSNPVCTTMGRRILVKCYSLEATPGEPGGSQQSDSKINIIP